MGGVGRWACGHGESDATPTDARRDSSKGVVSPSSHFILSSAPFIFSIGALCQTFSLVNDNVVFLNDILLFVRTGALEVLADVASSRLDFKRFLAMSILVAENLFRVFRPDRLQGSCVIDFIQYFRL